MEDHILQTLSNHKLNSHDEQKVIKKQDKKLGFGSLSLLFTVVGILFSFTDLSEPRMLLGEIILQKLHLNISTIPVSIAIFAIASIIGMKNKDDLFAESGSNTANVLLGLFFISLVISFVLNIVNFF